MSKATLTSKDIQRILGINKRNANYLISTGKFDKYNLYGNIRVSKKSFDKWYDCQNKYKKVNGIKPGTKLTTSLSIIEVGYILGTTYEKVKKLIDQDEFKTIILGKELRIDKDSFFKWCGNQNEFVVRDLSNPLTKAYPTTISKTEMENLLGIARKTRENICKRENIEMIMVDGKEKIIKESFDKWFNSQTKYKLTEYLNEDINKGPFIKRKEIKFILNLSDKGLNQLMNKEYFEVFKVDGTTYVKREEFNKWLESQNVYKKYNYISKKIDPSSYLTVKDISMMLNVSKASALDIIDRYDIKFIIYENRKLIDRISFCDWLYYQESYDLAPCAISEEFGYGNK